MNPIDVHGHLLPALDDGCGTLAESLDCMRQLAAAGYSRAFCTPHCGGLGDPTPDEIAALTRQLAEHAKTHDIPLELKPGGEVRLHPEFPEALSLTGVPTYANAGRYVLADLWEPDWPAWASRAVDWLQARGLIVILAHPERMACLLNDPSGIDELARRGLLFQGNLGPIGGADTPPIVALAHRFLQDGRYFLLGTDVHRPSHLPARLAGLQKATELVGPEKVRELTITHPARLWP